MKRRHWLEVSTILAASSLAAAAAHAAPALRVQVEQKGDFALIGNTLGHECAAGTPAPVVGTATCGGTGQNDSAPDIFWRADSPGAGQAEANTGITVTQARSTAVLSLPPGATVTHAFLYWAGIANNADTTVTIARPGTFTQDVTAVQSYTSTSNSYQSVANITSLVAAQGSGAYRVNGINTANVASVNENVNFAGWWMVVLYQLDTDPLRSLALFDGLDPVSNGNNQNTLLSGFLVPPAFGAAKLGVVAFEGDNTIDGDAFQFNGVTLSNGQNPANNFFNGTRSALGMPVSVAGDLPRLTGTAQSMSGMDIDIIDVTAQLVAGQTSAPIVATSSGDQYYLAGFVTSIPTFKPDFTTSEKSAIDLNGAPLVAGDTLEYTVVVQNSGSDTSVGTTLTDLIPPQLTYVPGSIEIVSGPGAGPHTDAAGDDQCEYNAALTTLTCRIGVGANAVNGGQMSVGASTSVRFLAKVKPGASGTISNQATINAGGLQGAPPSDTPTDGNGDAAGTPPTDVLVDQCLSDADCPAATPKCDVAATPNVCVECLSNSDCPGTEPTCNAQQQCVCVASGMEQCDGIDNNCDGTIDEGCEDTDGDGLSDANEILIGTNPNDADSDDDGVPDGQEPLPHFDSDGDGLINALDPDSDNDGLFDGTEMGFDCSNPATNLAAGACVPDADMGETVTNPLDKDTDDGGVIDGSEDHNLNGAIDAGETNPTAESGSDDLSDPNVDTDGDGLSDALELFLGTDPNDADSDDDGVPDGLEPNFSHDTDGDGLINALDPDSDNDGLWDGTEMGLDCSNPGTNAAAGKCIPDADPSTTTSPLLKDTDGGGVMDGAEDFNHNGAVDPGETDPTKGNGADDATLIDTDGDGLPDAYEILIGTDPNDADSDDDGVPDGLEPNPTDDTDGDSLINALDPDSDNDGLWDGTEMGFDCSNPGTNVAAGNCIADADPSTTTSPLLADTDGGGVIDGDEDKNKNGKLDPGETDPTKGHGDDDFLMMGCEDDSDCGGPMSGIVCDPTTSTCIEGCHTPGNGCPRGEECTSTTEEIGECNPIVTVPCTTDADCGGPKSGKVCDPDANVCVDGCHTPGNGCPDGQECTSTTATIGQCQTITIPCGTDAECGDANSGKVCDKTTGTCVDGCHTPGNGCPDGQVCTSNNAEIGQCEKEPDTGGDVVVEGGGLLCACSAAGGDRSNGWWISIALSGLLFARRRRRRG